MKTPDSDPRRPRARREDTKNWCRGEAGVEHRFVVVPSKWPYRGQPCEWREHRWNSVFSPFWFCHHSIACARCSEISVHVITDPVMCPDYDGSPPG